MLTLAVVLLAVYAAAHVGAWVAGRRPPPAGVGDTLEGLLSGTVAWPTAATAVLVTAAVLVVLVAVVVLVMAKRFRRRSSRVDWTAKVLGRGDEIAGITRKAAGETATQLGVQTDSPGRTLGRAVRGGTPLAASWEDQHLLIAGPRVGKTIAYAIPEVLEAPGPALVTSNNRDIVDATRGPREDFGPVWVFDPQSIANESPDWWWDPISYVTDEVKAATLAAHFQTATREPDAKTDAHFDAKGEQLVADLLLAAACDGRAITAVHRWITRPTDDEAARILERHGYAPQADRLAAVVRTGERERGAIFTSGERMVASLTSLSALEWVTRRDGEDPRPQFDPEAFVRDGGTLYSLSQEGRGTTGPLVTALTVAVIEAAQERATRQPRGRLPVPLVGVLDEAANVVKWRDLPDLVSFLGKQGICLSIICQSWSQGKQVWGEAGMNKLWSAVNVATYIGGSREVDFLESLVKLIGNYDKPTRSVSTRKGEGASTSHQLTREPIFEAADLAALPRGRAVILSSGNRPTLAEPTPWTRSSHAEAVRASIRKYDPHASKTLDDVDEGEREVRDELTSWEHQHEEDR